MIEGLKELTVVENHGFVIAPLLVRPVNEHDTVLFPDSIDRLVDFAHLISLNLAGSYFTLDSGFEDAGKLFRW